MRKPNTQIETTSTFDIGSSNDETTQAQKGSTKQGIFDMNRNGQAAGAAAKFLFRLHRRLREGPPVHVGNFSNICKPPKRQGY